MIVALLFIIAGLLIALVWMIDKIRWTLNAMYSDWSAWVVEQRERGHYR